MMKIGVADPGFEVGRQAADGGGKMDMEIAFEIAAESMNGGINAWDEVVLSGKVNDDLAGDGSKFVEKVAVVPEEGLKMVGDCESNMLPSRVRESVKGGFNPVVGGLFATGGTEAGFAGMGRFDRMEAFWADKNMPAEHRSPTSKHFQDVNDNGLTDQVAMSEKEFPPIAVIEKYVSGFDMTADEFHKGTYNNFKSRLQA